MPKALGTIAVTAEASFVAMDELGPVHGIQVRGPE